jgi:hypothetical protein
LRASPSNVLTVVHGPIVFPRFVQLAIWRYCSQQGFDICKRVIRQKLHDEGPLCTPQIEALAELAKKLPPGRLYSTGRGFVPSVGRSLYDRIVEQLKLAGQPVPDEADQPKDDRPGAAQAAPGLPSSWDDVAVGHLVIAQESLDDGWWEAIVLARDGDMLTLKWRDYPWQPNVLRHAGSVALLKPTPVST